MVQLKRNIKGRALKVRLPRLAHKKYINLLMLLRVEGWLLSIEAIIMLIPCVIALIYEPESSLPFFIVAGITGSVGVLMTLINPKSKEDRKSVV